MNAKAGTGSSVLSRKCLDHTASWHRPSACRPRSAQCQRTCETAHQPAIPALAEAPARPGGAGLGLRVTLEAPVGLLLRKAPHHAIDNCDQSVQALVGVPLRLGHGQKRGARLLLKLIKVLG